MSSQPTNNDVHNRYFTISTRPVLLTDDGRPLPLFPTQHTPANLTDAQGPAHARPLPNEHWVQFPGLPRLHVQPGYVSEMEVGEVLDGSPPTGTTSFEFSICYPAHNGLGQADGRRICEAVERLVARMVADRTLSEPRGGGRREGESPARGRGQLEGAA